MRNEKLVDRLPVLNVWAVCLSSDYSRGSPKECGDSGWWIGQSDRRTLENMPDDNARC